ncbi:uncharacterized protein [Triticum aestivum]|uniref:uncharacterized protein isoform X1 n=1 Tax=Triticum aestivum TaxID=4565 RepID=UPI000842B9CA|nr:uncharacterized protein LOC123168847 isoform X1 [Triticum aestivum]
MASGPVLRVRQLGARPGGQGAVPGDPERILRSRFLHFTIFFCSTCFHSEAQLKVISMANKQIFLLLPPTCVCKTHMPRTGPPLFPMLCHAVLSDSGKRLLYDVGVYDSDDDRLDEQHVSGMGGFFGEMAEMMSQATPTDSFEELQQLFVDMFQADLVAGGFGGAPPMGRRVQAPAPSPSCTSGPTSAQARPSCNKGVNKRCSSAMGSGTPPRACRPGSASGPGLDSKGSDGRRGEEGPWTTTQEDASIGGRKKKQRLSTGHGVSS